MGKGPDPAADRDAPAGVRAGQYTAMDPGPAPFARPARSGPGEQQPLPAAPRPAPRRASRCASGEKKQDISDYGTIPGRQNVVPVYRILYVDDEPALLEIGKIFLERGGQFVVDTITSAPEALTLMGTKDYDAIISDYQMPDMDGIEFLKKVRTSGNTIPFILFTGRGREEVVIQSLNEGADFYLQKGGEPVSQFAELAHHVRQAVQQKRAEADLRDYERREADIINFLPDATFAIDRSGHIIAWNRAIEEMTGVTAAAMLGKGDYEYALPFYGKRRPILIDMIFEPDDVIAERYAHITHRKDILIADTNLPDLKGRPVTLMVMASPLYNRQGEAVGALESIRDITERKLAEDALRESEEKYRSTIDALPDAVSVVDRECRLILTNTNLRSWLRTLGFSDDILGKPFLEAFPFLPRTVLDEYRTVFSTGATMVTEESSRIGSAEVITETRKLPLREHGDVVAVVAIIRDVTERRRADEALRESEERYRNVVEDQTEFISRFLPDGTHIFVNEAYCRYFGLERDKILGHRFRPRIPAGDRERMDRFFASLTPDHPVDTIEHRIVMPDGSIRWQRWSDRAVFDPSGAITEYQSVGRDITRTKETEIALRESEWNYRGVIDNLQDAFYRADAAGTIIMVSQSAAEMFGYGSTGEIIGLSLARDFYADPAGRQKFLDEIQKTGSVKNFEAVLKKKDGTPITVSTSAHYYRDPDGNVLGIEGIAKDITERKRAERALLESEERYRNVVEDQTEFISRFLPDGTHVFVNGAYCRYFGLRRDELLGHRFRPRIPAEDRERVGQFFASLTPGHPVDSIEHRIVMPDGSIRWQRWSDRAIFGPSGTVTEYQSVGRDITGRKREEQALHENEQRINSIYNTVGDALYQLSVEPHGQYRFRSINAAFSRITGLSPGQVIGRLVDEVIPEPSLSLVREKYRQAIAEKGIVRWEETTRYPTGELVGDISISPIFDREGNCTHLIGSAHDITGRKRAEDALRESGERFRLLFNSGRDAIAVHKMGEGGLPTHFIQVNDVACERLGYTQEEMLRLSPQDIDAPELSGQMPAVIGKLLKTGHVLFETEQVAKDGHRIPVEISTVLFELDGSPAAMSVARDITERRRADAALRESEERFRTIFENQQTGLVMVDAETHVIVDANRIALSLFGAASGDVVGRVCHTFICPAEEGKCPVTDLGQTVDMSERVLLNVRGERIPVIKSVSRVTLGGRSYLIESFTDISGRKQAEAELREREETFRSLVQESTEGIVITDEEGRLIVWNDAAARITGIPAAEALGSPFSELMVAAIPPERRQSGEADRIRSIISEALRTGESPYFYTVTDAEILRRDGERRTVRQTGFPIRTAKGFRIGAIIRDVTGRRQVEEVLKKSEARLRRAEEVGRSGSWEFRLSENAVDASKGARLIYGMGGTRWTIDEVQKIPLPEYRPLLDIALRDLIAGTSPYDMEFRIRRQTDGAILDIHSVAEYDPVQNVVFGVIHDVTGLKEAEELTRTTLQRLDTLISRLNSGVMMVSEDGRVEHLNQALCELYNLPDPPESLRGITSDEMIEKIRNAYAFPDEVHARVRELTAQGKPVKGYEVTLRNGKIILVDYIPVTDGDGRRRGRIWHHLDITGRKRAEEVLRQANKKLSLLSGITRHDINNQMTVLQSYLAILEKGEQDPAQREYLRKAEAAAERISSIIRFTKQYEAIGASAPAWQDCRALADGAIRQAPRGKLATENEIPAGIEIFADPLVTAVFFNLMDNAVRHGGTITTLRFSAEERGGALVLVCEDDGAGVPAGDKERIFERGFGRNTGLGLALAREILAITGITIRETGEPGRGARFEMVVPARGFRVKK